MNKYEPLTQEKDTIVNEPTFDIGNKAVSNDLITEDRLNSLEKTYPLVSSMFISSNSAV